MPPRSLASSGKLNMVYHQSAWSAYKTVRWTVKIAAQNASKIAILRLKMENFSVEGHSRLSRPLPSEGHPLPIPHPPRCLRRLDCRAHGAPTSAPSAPPLAPASLDHWVPPRFWKSGYGPDNGLRSVTSLQYEEFCDKSCVIKRPETLTVWSAFC